MTITHSKVSAKSDGADNTLIQPSDWNDEHVIAAGYFLPRIATATLIDAQIKTLPSIPVEIVPTPGAGKMIVLLYGLLSTSLVSPYNNVTAAGNNQFTYGGVMDASNYNLKYMFDDISANVAMYSTIQIPSDGFSLGLLQLQSWFEDKSITFSVYNADGNFGGGDPANTIKITVIYHIIDL
jgi:hypothetical protein